jgi:hypothetical protein
MLNPVLMKDERRLVVDPLYMVENPYDLLGAASNQTFFNHSGGATINYGSRSQSSSIEASPVEPELAEIINKKSSLESGSMASDFSR